MMNSAWNKNNRREIWRTLGRYLAILMIIALGVGFFSGLKITKEAMLRTGNTYIAQSDMYDYRLLSTLGFTREDADYFHGLDGVKTAEGAIYTDFIAELYDRKDLILKAHSITRNLNHLNIVAGRSPKADNECLADALFFTEENLGQTIRVSLQNDEDTLRSFAYPEYTIVGLCNSVNYMYRNDRGSTKLEGGTVNAFLYLPEGSFSVDFYTELYLLLDLPSRRIFSKDYETAISALEQPLSNEAKYRAELRYQSITEEADREIADAQKDYDASYAEYLSQKTDAEKELESARKRLEDAKTEISHKEKLLTDGRTQLEESEEEYNKASEETESSLSDAKDKLAEALEQINAAKDEVKRIDKPSCYVLDRSKNIGYTSFENDSSVVEGIAKIFPLFFFLVAALVCSTTMTRMVDEQRTQIGTLMALGYSNGSIARKYVFYSGSAAVLGCILGYLAGTRLFPFAIWQAYKMLYRFAEIEYVFSGSLALLTLLVSLLCSVGATYGACRTELLQMPAQLMRPKAPKAGKRIFLERLPFLWRRINFLHKVSVRNILRYKKRLFMMILGTGGCTALLLAGLGLKDSISNIADDQFDTIMMYDYTLAFPNSLTGEERELFREDTSDLLSQCVFIATDTYDFTDKKGSQKINVIATDDPDITRIIGLHLDGKTVPYPDYGYVAINDQLARSAGVEIGDTMTINLNNTEYYTVLIGGIFKNYAFNYMYMTGATYHKIYGTNCSYKTAYANTGSGQLYDIAARLMKDYGASTVIVTQDTKNRVADMMNSLNYIVWLVIACACALSFVVMYNLSNINITERNREIATIKVLGFFPSETYSYVFRENIVITLLSTAPGLPAGILLHRFVMEQIKIEAVSFNIRIFPMSYLYALAVTFGLTILVNLILISKIDRIPMAESLKSVE